MRNMLRQLLNEQAQNHRQDILLKYLLKKVRNTGRIKDYETAVSMIRSAAKGVGYQMGSYEESALVALIRSLDVSKGVFYYRIIAEANNRVKMGDTSWDEYQNKVQYSEFAMYCQYTEEQLPKYFQSVTDFSRDTRAWKITEFFPHGDANPDYKMHEIQSMRITEKKIWD